MCGPDPNPYSEITQHRQCSGSGFFHQQAKKLFLLFSDFLMILSLKAEVNVPTEINKQNKLENIPTYLFWHFESN
jgi:hypothetical protein